MSNKYRKKPIEVEAVLFNVERWLYGRQNAYPMVETRECLDKESSLGGYFTYEPVIPTLEGDMIVSNGDYIIKGVQNEFYPCKPDIFELTYEKVEPEEQTEKRGTIFKPPTCGAGLVMHTNDSVYDFIKKDAMTIPDYIQKRDYSGMSSSQLWEDVKKGWKK